MSKNKMADTGVCCLLVYSDWEEDILDGNLDNKLTPVMDIIYSFIRKAFTKSFLLIYNTYKSQNGNRISAANGKMFGTSVSCRKKKSFVRPCAVRLIVFIVNMGCEVCFHAAFIYKKNTSFFADFYDFHKNLNEDKPCYKVCF